MQKKLMPNQMPYYIYMPVKAGLVLPGIQVLVIQGQGI